jgi:glycosyltransferase involved in cell wall biosynthesis
VADPAASAPPAPRLVVVVPCYNEERRLDTAAFRSFDRDRLGLRFCFVNDGSRDGTLALLQRLVSEAPGLGFVLDLVTNHGKAEAVRRGLLAALETGATYVGFWDADLATPLDELPRFEEVLDERPQVELVLGSRVRLLGRHIERRAARHYLGRVFATGASLTLGLAVYDTQCGAKLFRSTPRLRALLSEPFLTSWVFDVEVLARYKRSLRGEPGLTAAEHIYELPLRRWTDVPGSKVKAWDFVRSGVELFRIWNAYVRR